MFFTLLKIILACILVIGVPKISEYWPSMSGVIGVMPVFSLLFLLCVYIGNGGERRIVEYSATAAIGMIPACLLYLGIFYSIDKGGMNTLTAVGVGSGIWLIAVFIYQMAIKTV